MSLKGGKTGMLQKHEKKLRFQRRPASRVLPQREPKYFKGRACSFKYCYQMFYVI